MLIFLAVMDLGEGGTVLHSAAQPGLAFALFAASFIDTSTFHFLIATYEASEPGRGRERTALPSSQEPDSNNRHLGYSPF
jgi:hypothetical protein